jgi:hypothetical protein
MDPFCGLFYNAVSTSHYTTALNKWVGKELDENGLALSRYYHRICLQGITKNMKNLSTK